MSDIGPFDDESRRELVSNKESLPDDVSKEDSELSYRPLNAVTVYERDLDSFPEERKQEALERFKLLSLIGKELNGPWPLDQVKALIEKHKDDISIPTPSPRTVLRWRERYERSDGDLKSLIVRNHAKGNRKPKVVGDEYYFDLAVQSWLEAERPKISKAYERYSDSIDVANENIVAGKIPCVSYKTFSRRLKQLPPYAVALQRHGKYFADLWYRHNAKHKPPTRVLERVEIDHTQLDLMLLHDEYLVPIGRPCLTMLIDVFSGCIIGFHLGFHAPGYATVAKALLNAMKPKDYVKDLPIELNNQWLCEGKIERLVMDNGAEFWSKSIDDACKELNIAVQYNPVKKPWLKPFIERSFGILNQTLLDTIPGKTFSNVLEKGDYDAANKAVMKFSTFVEELHRWIIDVHNAKADSRNNRLPNLYWRQSVKTLPPPRLPVKDSKQLSIIMGLLDKRKLTEKGLQYEDLFYRSQALADYRARFPQTKESAMKTIKVDPDDMSRIFVFLEELDGYIEVPCDDPVGYTKHLSLHEHLIIKRAHKLYIKGHVDTLSLAKARLALAARMEEETEDLRTFKRKRKPPKNMKKMAEFSGISSAEIESKPPTQKEKAPKNSKDEELKKAAEFLDEWEEILGELDDE
ncbi:Mu transposase C-terminal domain-containing protein [Enterovibrio paralichthyis]|uniref:Mu transposase C-terminal domain-containing protein n=1 Tax=Enterovibrio paralichthyis TaxID=2853805 RepID=UPI001C48D40C|nr:DDE-type integrase/transposase/recombinase [Enterovibrio paralichthyis]MBV7297276.1 DDE-type integrase/transposase/recombinase [Enterovibrio paralichthyis]